jgi:hypothetical protein
MNYRVSDMTTDNGNDFRTAEKYLATAKLSPGLKKTKLALLLASIKSGELLAFQGKGEGEIMIADGKPGSLPKR